MLTLKQITDICMLGKGSSQCRYLAEDEIVPGKFYCLKKVLNQKPEIDSEVDEFIKKHKSRGNDPYSMGMPLGSNCSGYLLLKSKPQGYDIP